MKEDEDMFLCPKPGEWVKGKMVGWGSFGTVHLAMNKSTGGLFVVKSAESQAALDSLEHEANILENLSSPHIVKCIGRENFKGVNGDKKLNLFIEYMAGGSLADIADKFEGVLDERMVRLYTREILKGLVYLHNNGVVHCDLKCKNVLLSSSGNIKIADFGCAKRLNGSKINSSSVESLKSICGTPLWMAPEVLRKQEIDYTSDIWSLGCTVIEMATGKPPKWGDEILNPMSAVFKIACSNETPKFPKGFSKDGLDFLHKCFERDVKKRWTSQKLLQHPFVSSKLEKINAENEEVLSPSSVLDVGLYEVDEDDIVSQEPICKREINRRIPFTMRNSGERDYLSNRHSTNNLIASSGNWITVRIN
ncbi:hypothetical protein ACET3Z_030661 [Daucus carota]